MFRNVYIYNDEGTSPESVQGWVRLLRYTLLCPPSQVHTVTAAEIEDALHAQLPAKTALVMPGGADMHYMRLLGGTRAEEIRRVVAAGASYVGVCAGAYFASSACIFEPDDPQLRVVGERPLGLVPYAAVGAVRAGFCYESEAGRSFERLWCNWQGRAFAADVYCNGGAAWDIAEGEATAHTIVARYADAVLKRHGIANVAPAAVVHGSFGCAGTVVLSGVHPELPLRTDDGRNWAPESMDAGCLLLVRSVFEAALRVALPKGCQGSGKGAGGD